jgi:arginine exporter protein ArgO
MTTSKRFAKLIGPTIVALTMSEAVNLRTMLNNPAPIVLVYLNGTLLFIAGLAIVRDHNRWKFGWPLLITLAGWFLILGGLFRMFAPVFAQQEVQHATSVYVGLFVGFAAGVFLTFKGFGRDDGKTAMQA